MSPDVTRQVAVIGEGACSRRTAAAAERIGRAIATAGAVLFTGGRGGGMEAAPRGAAPAGGTLGRVLPRVGRGGAHRLGENPGVTGLGQARNGVLVPPCAAGVPGGGVY